MLIACQGCRRQYDVEGMRSGEHVRCRCGKLVEVPESLPRQARTLHCSSCGGKLREAARSCEYCGSEITALERNLGPACPECFARLRGGARFCSECGVEIRPEAIRTVRAAARCPRCRGDLALREVEGGRFTECLACAGIWLEAEAFEEAVRSRDVSTLSSLVDGAAPEPRAAASTAADAAPLEAPVRYIPCPVCAQMMHRKNFAAVSGVILDWCKGHGYWFDTHELEKIIAFVDAGGMDRARSREIDRAREEVERLERQKRVISTSGPFPHTGRPPADWIGSLGDIWLMVRRLLK